MFYFNSNMNYKVSKNNENHENFLMEIIKLYWKTVKYTQIIGESHCR